MRVYKDDIEKLLLTPKAISFLEKIVLQKVKNNLKSEDRINGCAQE